MPWRITDISATQFRVEKTDELTDTIVEESTDFNKDECLVNVGTDTSVEITDKADSQGYKFTNTDLVLPTFSTVQELSKKLQAICFT